MKRLVRSHNRSFMILVNQDHGFAKRNGGIPIILKAESVEQFGFSIVYAHSYSSETSDALIPCVCNVDLEIHSDCNGSLVRNTSCCICSCIQ